jgi:hypothetical protein
VKLLSETELGFKMNVLICLLYPDGEIYTSSFLPNVRYPELVQLGFRRSLRLISTYTDSSLGVSEITIVGVGSNQARGKG